MSIEQAVKARLDAHAGTAALVDDRNHPQERPQDGLLPANVYSVINDEPVHAMGADAAVRIARIRIHSYATSFGGAVELSEQVRLALSRFRGTSASVVIQDSLEDDMLEAYAPEAGVGVFHRARDFRVFYEV